MVLTRSRFPRALVAASSQRANLAPRATAWRSRLALVAVLGLSSCGAGEDAPGASCLEPTLSAEIELSVVAEFPEISFTKPISAVQQGSAWYVTEQRGRIVRFTPPHRSEDSESAGQATTEVVLDITDLVDGAGPDDFWELGLFGIAFHPDFPTDPRGFVHYTVPVPLTPEQEAGKFHTKPARSIVSSFEFDPASGSFDRATEKQLLTLPQPGQCHNGGAILFDEAGYLLLSFGDGCGYRERAQDIDTIYGALLRLDVDRVDLARGTPYAIPPENPFVGDSRYAPEIIAYGLRNPWRVTIDKKTQSLWLGDVGSDIREEVDRVEIGTNYGWPRFEGTVKDDDAPLAATDDPVAFPISELCREDISSFAVVGGYVYRGTAIPELVGTYVFADGMSGTLYGVPADSGEGTRPTILGQVPGAVVSSFAEDSDGELFVLDRSGGGFYSLVGGPPVPAPARVLSRTRFVDANQPSKPPARAVSYTVNIPFFSDGATKERWFVLPPAGQIEIDRDTGHLLFPAGTTFTKFFHRFEESIETRLLRKIDGSHWRGYSYAWGLNQQDATLLDTGMVSTAFDERWLYPSRTDCMRCHTPVAGHALGLNIRQLAGSVEGDAPDQLDIWREWGFLSAAPDEFAELRELFPPFPAPDDSTTPLSEHARAFLHVNCSNCHRPGGPSDDKMDLRAETSLEDMGICDVAPSVSDLDIEGARIVAPGDPDRSILYRRLLLNGQGRMHPYRLQLDVEGAELLRGWIEDLSCSR